MVTSRQINKTQCWHQCHKSHGSTKRNKCTDSIRVNTRHLATRLQQDGSALQPRAKSFGGNFQSWRCPGHRCRAECNICLRTLYPRQLNPCAPLLQPLPESLDPDSVLEGGWAQGQGSADWPQPEGLEMPLQAFRHWLRHVLWELTSLLVQVCCFLTHSTKQSDSHIRIFFSIPCHISLIVQGL